jgi:hypothetical protein
MQTHTFSNPLTAPTAVGSGDLLGVMVESPQNGYKYPKPLLQARSKDLYVLAASHPLPRQIAILLLRLWLLQKRLTRCIFAAASIAGHHHLTCKAKVPLQKLGWLSLGMWYRQGRRHNWLPHWQSGLFDSEIVGESYQVRMTPNEKS